MSGREIALRYAASFAAWVAALGLTLALAPHLQRAMFVFFWIAILFAAWWGGLVPALIAALAAVVAVNYIVIPPGQAGEPLTPSDFLTLTIFIGASGLVSKLVASRARSQRETAEALEQLQEQAVELEQQMEEAQALSEELEEANARLQQTTREAERARAEAESAAGRVALLQDVTAALSRALTREEVAQVVVGRLAGALGAHIGVLALLTPAGDHLAVTATETVRPESWRKWETFPLDAPVPLAEAARTRALVTLGTFAEIAERAPAAADICAESGTQALCAVPVASEGRVLGALGLSFRAPHAFPPEFLTLLATLAAQCAQALERAQLYEAEHLARAEAEAARAEAERANRAKSEFLAVMSHELRTPLNAIGGYAELLEMGIRGPVTEAQVEDIERIKRSQQRLLSLINDVLSFARIDAGRVRYEVTALPLADALADVEALLLPQMRTKGLAFEVHEPEQDIVVRADRERVEQIVLNLLSNAVKFTAPGGRVTLECATRDHVALVRVSDTGRGVPPDQLESIFQPFVQVEVGHTRTVEGTGLGLAISRDLARGMGGDLTAESTPGVGSTFTLVLPTVAGRRAGEPSAEQA